MLSPYQVEQKNIRRAHKKAKKPGECRKRGPCDNDPFHTGLVFFSLLGGTPLIFIDFICFLRINISFRTIRGDILRVKNVTENVAAPQNQSVSRWPGIY